MFRIIFAVATALFITVSFAYADVVPDGATMEESKRAFDTRPSSPVLVPMTSDSIPLFNPKEAVEQRRSTTCSSVAPQRAVLEQHFNVASQRYKSLWDVATYIVDEMEIPQECLQFVVRTEDGNDWVTDLWLISPNGDLVLVKKEGRVVAWDQTLEKGLRYYAMNFTLDPFMTARIGIER